jgi:hypothetical protein
MTMAAAVTEAHLCECMAGTAENVIYNISHQRSVKRRFVRGLENVYQKP